MKYKQHDIATIRARVELPTAKGALAVIVAADGSEIRQSVHETAIIAVEPGPIRAGDKVTKGKGKTLALGTVQHRIGDQCWILWGDESRSLEPVDGLAR
jgi:hypothetical protein